MDKYNILTLAFIGDAHYNLFVKRKVIDRECKVNEMQKFAAKYCSARFQASAAKYLLDNNLLTEKEVDIFKRGRNAKSHGAPRNTDILTYKASTGFEAVWGLLYLENNDRKMTEIWEKIENLEVA